MKYHYPAVFLKEEDGITVTFPDFEYLVTCGATWDEAYEKAEECLGMGVSDCVQEDRKLPSATDLDQILLQENECSAIVTIDLEEWLQKYSTRSVRRNITLPEWLDRLAAKRKINVSKVCQEAIQKALDVK